MVDDSMPPDRGLSDKQASGVKGKKLWLTYLFVANANGSRKLPLLIIGKAQKPRAFKNKTGPQLGFNYMSNAKAWMTSAIYQEWLLNWGQKLKNENHKILLLQDNFSGHVVPESLANIRVVNFEPNLTAHIQPNDQGIIRCFKAHYHAKFIHCAIDQYEASITPSHIYDIDQLEAMRLADEAWNEVDTTTIQNCWRKAGFLPDTHLSQSSESRNHPVHPSLHISSLITTTLDSDTPGPVDPITELAERLVNSALDDLEITGALQHSNRMDIAELLNPAAETPNFFDASDEDIFRAVMDAKMAREGGKSSSDEVGNLDTKDDPDAASEPSPTRSQALQACMLLKRYIVDMDDPAARKLEVMLGSFGRMTWAHGMQNMENGKITDFFTCK